MNIQEAQRLQAMFYSQIDAPHPDVGSPTSHEVTMVRILIHDRRNIDNIEMAFHYINNSDWRWGEIRDLLKILTNLSWEEITSYHIYDSPSLPRLFHFSGQGFINSTNDIQKALKNTGILTYLGQDVARIYESDCPLWFDENIKHPECKSCHYYRPFKEWERNCVAPPKYDKLCISAGIRSS